MTNQAGRGIYYIMKKLVLRTLVIAGILSVVVFGGAVFADYSHQDNQAATPPKIYTPEELLVEANKLRAAKGVAPLKLDAGLNESARLKAEDMRINDYYGHINPKTGKNGYTIVYDVTKAQCYGAGENLDEAAIGYNPFDAVSGWPTSPGHYAGEVDPKNDTTGFAYTEFNGKGYYVQHFCDLAQ